MFPFCWEVFTMSSLRTANWTSGTSGNNGSIIKWYIRPVKSDTLMKSIKSNKCTYPTEGNLLPVILISSHSYSPLFWNFSSQITMESNGACYTITLISETEITPATWLAAQDATTLFFLIKFTKYIKVNNLFALKPLLNNVKYS